MPCSDDFRRRAFLRAGSAGVGCRWPRSRTRPVARRRPQADAAFGRSPADVAGDEDYWREIQQAFTLDRTIINLNNGGAVPSPRVVHEAFKRYLDISNQAPVYHMWQILEPNIETVRRRLAAEFGCDPEEMAITRNASEALQIAQLGIDLKPGDEVVTTNQDYGRMLDTWDQRARRDGIVVKKISFPVPPPSMDDLADRLHRRDHAARRRSSTSATSRTSPARSSRCKKICDAARAKGIKTIVDGAHAFAHFPFKPADLGCDYYGTSLHKWLLAPIGTGFLYVRRENIESLWPLTPDQRRRAPRTSASSRRSARTRRRTTTPSPRRSASTTASASSGSRRGCATCATAGRRACRRPGRFKIHTSMDPAQSCAIGTVQIARRADGARPSRSCGTSGGSSPRRSCTPNTKASASRRTSTRRSRRSTPSATRWNASPGVTA